MGTIQFAGAVHEACAQVADHFDEVAVPQAKPLSPGEVLGCTAPVIEGKDALVFVADGRFHLEVCPGTKYTLGSLLVRKPLLRVVRLLYANNVQG